MDETTKTPGTGELPAATGARTALVQQHALSELALFDNDRLEFPGKDVDAAFYRSVEESSQRISFRKFEEYMNAVMCDDASLGSASKPLANDWKQLRFFGVKAYDVLKRAAEVFLLDQVGLCRTRPIPGQESGIDRAELEASARRRREEITSASGTPYAELMLAKLNELTRGQSRPDAHDEDFARSYLGCPLFIELIWSYWHEEGMLVQTMNAISMRYQNRRVATRSRTEALSRLELSPLKALNNLLWGYLQDEPDRLSVVRRSYEYSHHYGLCLLGRAVPEPQTADSRSKFLQSFHALLNTCVKLFKQEDDRFVRPDGFPVLQSLKDVQMVLGEGMHNQYGDLPWTARAEMMIQQWFLARSEMQQFLGGRAMVPYPEGWMDRVETMKGLMGWGNTSVTHFHDLAVSGEILLLTIRYGGWTDSSDPDRARFWAKHLRKHITTYLFAYRAATGVDLTGASIDATLPAIHLKNRFDAATR
ncbi:hypothetical protein JY651_13905 [Pyxidicoccus parkwayensis]|uniref:Zorya protein ZorC EH domain-containing protein n=1 Tax=Pyxidicoccus parkwayensis TaxID=2813578 RepID=A0ABX7P673_9BACT|nr:hypothetical protein [Pyxidicoccus parkwaysis]QSQ25952.1 hypothetical protein JY651_13905 [Pyxidicoccus parkwaysis]